MDNTSESGAPQASGNKMIIPAVVVGVIVIALVAFFALGMNKNKTASSVQPSPEVAQQTTEAPSPTNAPVTGTKGASTTSEYKDGTYNATGHYVSPGGPRNLDVSLTLNDGVITAATCVGHATDPNSMRFQGEFRTNFQPQVVGKNIDDVNVTKVAGSSLAPIGFMDAVTQIKSEAKA